MTSSDGRVYVYLQLPQSHEVVTAGYYELAFPQGVANLRLRLQPGLSAPPGRRSPGPLRTAPGTAVRPRR